MIQLLGHERWLPLLGKGHLCGWEEVAVGGSCLRSCCGELDCCQSDGADPSRPSLSDCVKDQVRDNSSGLFICHTCMKVGTRLKNMTVVECLKGRPRSLHRHGELLAYDVEETSRAGASVEHDGIGLPK